MSDANNPLFIRPEGDVCSTCGSNLIAGGTVSHRMPCPICPPEEGK